MVLRRIARLVLLAFIAGPALNLECLLFCGKTPVAASSERCHRTASDDATVGNHQACNDPQTQGAPFVKSGNLPVLLFAIPTTSIVEHNEAAIRRPFPTGVSGTGPPDSLAVIPLRI